ncbi:MAG: hypothetical protein WED04_12345 [Promethearchaeati archaeon SRVP18_Atabeyarchaeia-1]
MGEKSKPVKVVAIGGSGAGVGALGGLGVAAASILFIINAFTAFLIVSGIWSIFSIVSSTGLNFSAALPVLGEIVSRVGSAASSISLMLYLDVVAFAFIGVALILVRVKMKEAGISAIIGAIAAFAFAGVAYYVRFTLLPPIMSTLDQVAVSGLSTTSLILLGSVVLQAMNFTTIFLVQGIVFFAFGIFMRGVVNNLNRTYGKMTRGGRLILTVSIMNLVSMAALYYATSALRTVLEGVLASLGGGGSLALPDITTLLPTVVAFGLGVFLKLITIPIMAAFAYLSLTFGFYGMAKGPK